MPQEDGHRYLSGALNHISLHAELRVGGDWVGMEQRQQLQGTDTTKTLVMRS